MAWKTRSGHRYYYRTRWQDGRSQTIYYGRGAEAEKQAQQDADRHREKQTRRARLLADEARVAAAELLLHQLTDWTAVLTMATLLLTGHYNHHGTWRRKAFLP